VALPTRWERGPSTGQPTYWISDGTVCDYSRPVKAKTAVC